MKRDCMQDHNTRRFGSVRICQSLITMQSREHSRPARILSMFLLIMTPRILYLGAHYRDSLSDFCRVLLQDTL